MDGAQSLCASMSLQISSSESSPLCVARSHGCRACARHDGRAGGAGDYMLQALIGAEFLIGAKGGVRGSGASVLQTVIGTAALTDARGGAEVHGGCADNEAGNPADVASIIFPPGGV